MDECLCYKPSWKKDGSTYICRNCGGDKSFGEPMTKEEILEYRCNKNGSIHQNNDGTYTHLNYTKTGRNKID